MNKRRAVLGLSLACGLLSSLAAPSASAAPKSLGTFGDWQAFVQEEAGKQVCFMASRPKQAEGNYAKRDDVYMLVTHRPMENSYNVVSVTAGYTYKTGSEVTVRIDGDTFKLFTEQDVAWAKDDKTDAGLFAALKSGSKVVVKGVSGRGTETTDTYSLKGSSSAAEAIDKACRS